jgi:lysozyme
MNYHSIEEQIATHEGFRSKPYRCPAGKLTIGYGRNIEDSGISSSEAFVMLKNDIKDAEKVCVKMFPKWELFDIKRRWALIDMAFNLGESRFRGFKRMIAAINRDDWKIAAKEAMDSKWYVQVGLRAKFVVAQIREGGP